MIEIGTDKEARDKDGDTPLHWACQIAKPESLHIAEHLIQNQCNKNARNNDGITPLHRASYYFNFLVVQYLIKIGCNKEEQDNKGRTP